MATDLHSNHPDPGPDGDLCPVCLDIADGKPYEPTCADGIACADCPTCADCGPYCVRDTCPDCFA
jgi:hypothetical protein